MRHLHAMHRYYRLSPTQASAIEREVREVVSGWRTIADALKLGRVAQSQLDAIIDATRD